jgi:hypothetical protein
MDLEYFKSSKIINFEEVIDIMSESNVSRKISENKIICPFILIIFDTLTKNYPNGSSYLDAADSIFKSRWNFTTLNLVLVIANTS